MANSRKRRTNRKANKKNTRVPRPTRLPSSWKLTRSTLKVILANRLELFYLTVIFIGLYILLSQALSASNVAGVIDTIKNNLGVNPESLGGRFLVAGSVLQLSGTMDGVSAGYMLFVTLIVGLSVIWILRHFWAQKKTTAREALYKSPYALVPLLLLVLLAIVQLLPLSIGSALTDVAFTKGIVVTGIEKIATFLLLVILPLTWSVTMVVKTLFAMIIVTVPDMRPVAAYKSAKTLLKKRRVAVLSRLLLIALGFFVAACGVLVAVIAAVPALTVISVIIINSIGLIFGVSLLYVIYRQML